MGRTNWDEQAGVVKAEIEHLRRKIRWSRWLGVLIGAALGGTIFFLTYEPESNLTAAARLAILAVMGGMLSLSIVRPQIRYYRRQIRQLAAAEDERQRNYLFEEFARHRSAGR